MKEEILEIVDELNGDLEQIVKSLADDIKHKRGNPWSGDLSPHDVAEYLERTLNSVTYSLTQIRNILN